ncbi:MAG TPA: hypothetical protein VGL62_14080 [Vicinamibacterales bacterium]|jgi:hypothetical protein
MGPQADGLTPAREAARPSPIAHPPPCCIDDVDSIHHAGVITSATPILGSFKAGAARGLATVFAGKSYELRLPTLFSSTFLMTSLDR